MRFTEIISDYKKYKGEFMLIPVVSEFYNGVEDRIPVFYHKIEETQELQIIVMPSVYRNINIIDVARCDYGYYMQKGELLLNYLVQKMVNKVTDKWEVLLKEEYEELWNRRVTIDESR